MLVDGVVTWPESFASAYRNEGYWRGVTLGDALARSFAENAERVAVVDGARRVTYRELGEQAERAAGHLVAAGVAGGARVVFQLPNTLEFIVLYVACLKVGAIPIAALPHHRHAEIGAIARLADAAAWFVAESHRGFDFLQMAEELRPELPSLREIWVVGDKARAGMTLVGDRLASPAPAAAARASPPRPGDVAVFQLSGGTTGLPKLIPRTHDDYAYNSLAFARACGFDRDSVLLVPIPIAHNFPLACPGVQGALLLGARVVLAPSPAADVVFPLIEAEKVTWIPAVPATLIQWTAAAAKSRHDLGSIRAIYVGGQRLNAEPAAAAVRAFGPVVRQVYGMAEGLLCCTRPDDPEAWHLETQGRPVSPADDLRIVDDDGAPVADGELGELECRGPYTLRGYYKADAHNATAFTADGYYRTGDMVRRHPSGNLMIEGRKKDLINRGGEKISAEEIENLILGHASVANVAVVAIPDPVLGERACACVVLKPGASLTLEELARFLRDEGRISPAKIPERLEVRERLPLTGVGKISKKDLREELRLKLQGR